VRVALIHDWVVGLRGGERVLDELLDLFPQADVFTLFHAPGSTTERIDAHVRGTSPLNRLPGACRHYRKLLPLYPWAVRRLAVHDYDLVLSVHHAVAKAVRLEPGTPHLCYCLTPMRYIWDQADAYLGHGFRRLVAAPFAASLRRFDRRTAGPTQVSRFVAISETVARRVERHYGRRASIVYPPVDIRRFRPHPLGPRDYYLLVTSFGPYKRAELAVQACERLGRELVVVGDGPRRRAVEARARGRVQFVGRVPDTELAEWVSRCRALLQPQEEDFGIAAVEAQATGRPVIAFDRGGAAETVRPWFEGADGATGIWFSTQSAAALAEAILRFEAAEKRFHPELLRRHAERFSTERFRSAMAWEVEQLREAAGPAEPGA